MSEEKELSELIKNVISDIEFNKIECLFERLREYVRFKHENEQLKSVLKLHFSVEEEE